MFVKPGLEAVNKGLITKLQTNFRSRILIKYYFKSFISSLLGWHPAQIQQRMQVNCPHEPFKLLQLEYACDLKYLTSYYLYGQQHLRSRKPQHCETPLNPLHQAHHAHWCGWSTDLSLRFKFSKGAAKIQPNRSARTTDWRDCNFIKGHVDDFGSLPGIKSSRHWNDSYMPSRQIENPLADPRSYVRCVQLIDALIRDGRRLAGKESPGEEEIWLHYRLGIVIGIDTSRLVSGQRHCKVARRWP